MDGLRSSARAIPACAVMTVMTLLCGKAMAALCLPDGTVEKDSAHSYLLNLTQGLSYAHTAQDRTKALGKDFSDFDFLYGLKLAKGDFECARSVVAPFVASKNPAIEASAKGAETAFS